MEVWFTTSILTGIAGWIGYCWVKSRMFRVAIRLRFKEICN